LVKSDKVQLGKILELIQKKIEAFGFNIHNIKVLSAKYLDQYNIIAQHYGVINKIASNAVANMSESAKDKFQEIYGKSVNEVKVLGGFEFISSYKDFNANSLDFLLQNCKTTKLAGGTYCLPTKLDTEIVYLINGFHPRQLEHFTEPGRSIVVFTLSSDTNWQDARSNFIGATFPESANKGSIRRELLDNKDSFGLEEVSQGLNGVHLSAGPVEGLIELMRYNSDFRNDTICKSHKDFSFGKNIEANFTPSEVESILSNINLQVDGKMVSIFDLTEEKNSDDAIQILKEYFNN
jgi:nucleoside diphosphate kinase